MYILKFLIFLKWSLAYQFNAAGMVSITHEISQDSYSWSTISFFVCVCSAFHLKSQKRIPWNTKSIASRSQSRLLCRRPISWCCLTARCSTISWPCSAVILSVWSFCAWTSGCKAFCREVLLPSTPSVTSSTSAKQNRKRSSFLGKISFRGKWTNHNNPFIFSSHILVD